MFTTDFNKKEALRDTLTALAFVLAVMFLSGCVYIDKHVDVNCYTAPCEPMTFTTNKSDTKTDVKDAIDAALEIPLIK